MSLTISEANECIDELVRMLQQNFKAEHRISVDEVVKGGSLGHGTAVPGHYDIDLVLYSRDIDPNDVLDMGVETVLKKLRVFLSSHFPNNFKFDRMSPFSLQFKFHNDIDVDLLLSPYWETPDKLHQFLQDKEEHERRKFSCSASKWQVQFFKKQPNVVKEYIKRFKAWRNECWPKDMKTTGKPSSFLLGLLMVEAYRRSNSKTADSVQCKLQDMIRNHHELNITWKDGYYDIANTITNQKEIDDLVQMGRYKIIENDCSKCVVEDTYIKKQITFPRGGGCGGMYFCPTTSTPTIIDPGNPYNNCYQTGIMSSHGEKRGWTDFADRIDSFNIHNPVD